MTFQKKTYDFFFLHTFVAMAGNSLQNYFCSEPCLFHLNFYHDREIFENEKLSVPKPLQPNDPKAKSLFPWRSFMNR